MYSDHCSGRLAKPPKVIRLISCSAQMSMKFELNIDINIVGIKRIYMLMLKSFKLVINPVHL